MDVNTNAKKRATRDRGPGGHDVAARAGRDRLRFVLGRIAVERASAYEREPREHRNALDRPPRACIILRH
jgi:hypothetical protein